MPAHPARPLARAAAALLALALTGGGVTAAPAERTSHTPAWSTAPATPKTSGGWTTNANAPGRVVRGRDVRIVASAVSSRTGQAWVRIEVRKYDGTLIFRRTASRSFEAGTPRKVAATWSVPDRQRLGRYRVAVRVLRRGGDVVHANPWADRFLVVPAHFRTLPVGADLPSDAQCADRVRPAAEVRPANRDANGRVGRSNTSDPWYRRVTGNFTGTTDQIIQWAACKWGIDEHIVRAQTAKESWWFQRNMGDWTTDASRCAPGHPIGADGRPGECPESFGVQQVRWPYHQIAFPYAISSTAFNLDYALAVRRSCFEGRETWFNHVERGREYAAGDMWGCVGAWFSGRWYTAVTMPYIEEVQGHKAAQIWRTPEFKSAT